MDHKSLHTVYLMYNNYCYTGGSLIPDISKIVEEIIEGRRNQHEELIEGIEEPPQREGLIEGPVQGDLMKGPAEGGHWRQQGRGVNGGGRAGGVNGGDRAGGSMEAAGQGGQWRR